MLKRETNDVNDKEIFVMIRKNVKMMEGNRKKEKIHTLIKYNNMHNIFKHRNTIVECTT